MPCAIFFLPCGFACCFDVLMFAIYAPNGFIIFKRYFCYDIIYSLDNSQTLQNSNCVQAKDIKKKTLFNILREWCFGRAVRILLLPLNFFNALGGVKIYIKLYLVV